MVRGLRNTLDLEETPTKRLERVKKQLKEQYGENLDKILGPEERRMKAVRPYESNLKLFLQYAEKCLEEGDSEQALFQLDQIDYMVKGIRIQMRIGNPSLDQFGRTEPLTRDVLEEPIKKKKGSLSQTQMPEDMKEDVAYMMSILDNRNEVLRLLTPLDKVLRSKKKDNTEGKLEKSEGQLESHALTEEFRKMEKKHKFPDVRVLPVGILSSEEFEGMTTSGWQGKDPGAGLAHGEHSHRLQWYALMQKFEEDNKDQETRWNYTPFELFTKISELDIKHRDNKTWFNAMDNPENTLGGERALESIKENPIKLSLEQSSVGGFTRPDEITLIFRSLSQITDSPLAGEINRLYEKRKQKMQESDHEATELVKQLESEFNELRNLTDIDKFKEGLQQFSEKHKEFCLDRRVGGLWESLKIFDNPKFANDKQLIKESLADFECPIRPKDYITYNVVYMKKYGEEKTKENSKYELASGGEKLLVAKESEDKDMVAMEPEERMLKVFLLRDESRKEFGLPPRFGDLEREELQKRVTELENTAVFHLQEQIDFVEVRSKAEDVGKEKGLGAAIVFLERESACSPMATKLLKWRTESRKAIKAIAKLQATLLEKKEPQSAALLEHVLEQLSKIPDKELISFLDKNEDPGLRIAEESPHGAIKFRDELLKLLKE